MSWIDRVLIRTANYLWRVFGNPEKENPFYFVITGGTGSPYMARYYLLKIPWLKFRVHLHHILRSDEDFELHDHPWNFVSIVLWEGYLEELRGGVVRRIRAGQVVRHRATDAHRLILARPAWTLVFCLGKKRVWGFYKWDGWVDYKTFLKEKFGAEAFIAH